jgi:hypothetical protein
MAIDFLTVLAPIADLLVAAGLVRDSLRFDHKVRLELRLAKKLLERALACNDCALSSTEAEQLRDVADRLTALLEGSRRRDDDAVREKVRQLAGDIRSAATSLQHGKLNYSACFALLSRVRRGLS